uniref:Uncharacterized protein n=1 Tax=Corethron hystrix TaxID=216773 RepID=A0A6U5F3Z1_9STRA
MGFLWTLLLKPWTFFNNFSSMHLIFSKGNCVIMSMNSPAFNTFSTQNLSIGMTLTHHSLPLNGYAFLNTLVIVDFEMSLPVNIRNCSQYEWIVVDGLDRYDNMAS